MSRYALTARTANQVKQLLADAGQLGNRATSGAPARGTTWVKVTGAADGEGWYPAVVSIDRAGTFEDLTAPVSVHAASSAAELEEGVRYLCTRTGDADDGTARFRTNPGAEGPPGPSSGWFARLTTSGTPSGYSVPGWKYFRLKLDAGGAYVDDGAESDDFTAIAATIDGVKLCNPAEDLQVWMKESDQAGLQEFLPIGYADGGIPGLLNGTTQLISGEKTFDNTTFHTASVVIGPVGDIVAPMAEWTSHPFALVNGGGGSVQDPVRVFGAGYLGATGDPEAPDSPAPDVPYVQVGDCTAVESGSDGGAILTPIHNSPSGTPNQSAAGVPLSVSGYVVTPEIRLHIAWPESTLGQDFESLFATWDSHSQLAVTVGGWSGGAYGYTTLTPEFVRVPPFAAFRVALSSTEDYVGQTRVETIGSKDFHFKGGLLMGVTDIGDPCPYVTGAWA